MSFALGTFSAGGPRFAGLVRGRRVLSLAALADLGPAPVTTSGLLANWDETLPVLTDLADQRVGEWLDLERLTVYVPLEPRQILQAGANYRTHVIDLAVALRRPDDPRPDHEVRAQAAAMMDTRAATGAPYLFIGLPSAVTGPYDNVTLPGYSDQHDWELELTAVIARTRTGWSAPRPSVTSPGTRSPTT